MSDDASFGPKPRSSTSLLWSERIQKIQTILSQQDLVAITDNEILLDTLIATWDDHRSTIKSIASPRKETSLCVKRHLDMIDNLKDLSLQMDDFEMIKPLAKGQFGTVYIVKSRLDDQVYAMKIQPKDGLLRQRETAFFMEEKNVLVQGNEWMPKLYASFQDNENLYLVMEYAGGGDLFSVLDRTETLTFNEDEARFYIAEMILAIESLHKLGYVHRDIKPQNILIDAHGHVKLADFGSCINLDEHGKVTSTTPVGTCDYISPEVLQAHEGNVKYGTEVDWWSVGIVLYEMLQELPPFYSDSVNETYRKIIFHEESLEFSDEYSISDDAKDLISRFLCNKEERLGCNGIDEIKSHLFFAGIDWDRIRESTPPFQPVLASPDDTSNFSVHDEEEDMSIPTVPGFARPATGQTRKESEGKNTPFIGYTCLKNVGIPLNEQTSINGNDDSICSFNREEEILRLKRQLDNTSRNNRTPILKFENPMDQPVLHSSQWITKNKLQS
ncbi:hypothetical protein INT43_006500 [Umbelopsis isabellina]|uniref:non-specific serine/threonine protein kinase n=1 Tax=Mortierella isabellina TaxID=91625 RepID=A0A8H7PZB2_MORIS|nr:hypothetical protein INT43_006500 [Umbelopsis isabellina]